MVEIGTKVRRNEPKGHTHGEEEHNQESEGKSGGRGQVGRRYRSRHCRASDSRGGGRGCRRRVAADRPGVAGRGKIGRDRRPDTPTGCARHGEGGEAGKDGRESQEGRQAGEEEKDGAPAFAPISSTDAPLRPGLAIVAVIIREESPADLPHVHLLLDRVFGGTYESRLVERLRAAALVAVALVAKEDEQIVGHIVMSRLSAQVDGRAVRALALAPMVVRPDRQRRGVGSRRPDRKGPTLDTRPTL